jgi:hypothetical protein
VTRSSTHYDTSRVGALRRCPIALSDLLTAQCRKYRLAVCRLLPDARVNLILVLPIARRRARAGCSGKAALWRFASVAGPTGNVRFGSLYAFGTPAP